MRKKDFFPCTNLVDEKDDHSFQILSLQCVLSAQGR
jgi:hypothetical protein